MSLKLFSELYFVNELVYLNMNYKLKPIQVERKVNEYVQVTNID